MCLLSTGARVGIPPDVPLFNFRVNMTIINYKDLDNLKPKASIMLYALCKAGKIPPLLNPRYPFKQSYL